MGRIFELIIVTFVLASFSNARQCDDGKIRGVNLGGWLLLGQKLVLFSSSQTPKGQLISECPF